MKLEKHVRQAAIEWFSDCTWREDVDSDYFNDLTDAEIIKGLNRHWGGGYEDFVHSCNWTGPYAETTKNQIVTTEKSLQKTKGA